MALPPVDYRCNTPLDPAAVCGVFERSGLQRPTHDPARIARMLDAADLTLSAWRGERLVGVARALTDFAYCCYLSDLAVDKAYQGQGIGRELIRRTQAAIGEEVSLILVAAPAAVGYYTRLGLQSTPNAFVVRRQR